MTSMIRAGTSLMRPGVTALLALTLTVSSPPMVAGGFVSGLVDVPLMGGLSETATGDVRFETAAGRIVEVTATGSVDPVAVLQFYRETLPQLGWCTAANGVFYREGERLMVGTDAGAGETTVSFTLAPARGAGCR